MIGIKGIHITHVNTVYNKRRNNTIFRSGRFLEENAKRKQSKFQSKTRMV